MACHLWGCQVGSSSLDSAMADPSRVGEEECPVISAWGKSSVVLARLLEKDLLILNGGKSNKLTRHTCVANRDLLVPLINLVGR